MPLRSSANPFKAFRSSAHRFDGTPNAGALIDPLGTAGRRYPQPDARAISYNLYEGKLFSRRFSAHNQGKIVGPLGRSH
jgi:hypothetical protein